MTDGQIRYQTIMENQRHNLVMEKIGSEEVKVSQRNAAVRESEEARAVDLHPQTKKLANAQTQANLIKVVEGAADTVNKGMQAARNFFGLFSDVTKFAGGDLGGLAGGYMQGSLFA